MHDTPDILKKIITRKKEEIKERKASLPLREIKKRVQDANPTHDFESAIQQQLTAGKPAIIAEIKKASPSRGTICEDFDPVALAQCYEKAGATCLSVLTDVDFFQGSDKDLSAARAACLLPILRKDFIIDPYQVYESRMIGADCILLIVAALTDKNIQELSELATELDMDVLIEVHDREELERGLMLRTPLIGINNRNLHTFETDIQTTLELLPDVFHDRIIVTESGIHTIEDVKEMRKHSVDTFLVGEAFMSSDDPGKKLKELFK